MDLFRLPGFTEEKMHRLRLKAPAGVVADYLRLFVNRRAYTLQSIRPHPESGRHYYYRPSDKETGQALSLTLDTLRSHIEGEITIALYAINPATQCLNDQMALNLDLAPTILDLAGVEIPSTMQGRSLVPLLEGKEPSPSWRKDWFYAFYEYPGPAMVPNNRGIRTERYKLIEYWEQEPKEYELYDLQSDPGEQHNLYGSAEYADLTK
jgi:hypothetical protein